MKSSMLDDPYGEVELKAMLLVVTASVEKWSESYLLSRLGELADTCIKRGELCDFMLVMDAIEFIEQNLEPRLH